MRRLLLRATAALGLCLALLAGTTRADKPAKGGEDGECSSYGGTAVVFYKTPSEAATKAQASKGKKLVMVLHVSGNFETPDFT